MYLYVIKCQQFYKIGVANDVESRLAQLSTGNPFALDLHMVYEFQNAEPVEKAIHQKFSSYRERGEWFDLNAGDLEEITQICLLLGGVANHEAKDVKVDDAEIEEAEELAEPSDGGKWDYAAMFADGWRIEPLRSGKYWQWRERRRNGKTIYGGSVADLPCSIEEMRNNYQKGLTS